MRIKLMALMLMVPALAYGYEIEDNPDRRWSFGIFFDHAYQNSEYSFGAFKQTDFTKVTGNAVSLDTRIPLNSALTFSVRGGIDKTTSDIFTGEKVDYSGYDIGFGFRVYLPK